MVLFSVSVVCNCSKEIGEDQLIERYDLMYEINSDKPYTGKSFALYESGQRKSERSWKNGIENGRWTSWSESGQIAHRLEFQNGEKHGTMESWYENGEMKEESIFYNGLQNGATKNMSMDGELEEVYLYKNGKIQDQYSGMYGELEGNERKLDSIAEQISKEGIIDFYALDARRALGTIFIAAQMYYEDNGEWPGDLEGQLEPRYMMLRNGTKRQWVFTIIDDGDGISGITALSTKEMKQGAGHEARYDTESGKFTGYGSDENEDVLNEDEILYKDAKYYEKKSGNLVTGTMASFNSTTGQKQLSAEVVQGEMNGAAKKWYSNGQIKEIALFKNGKNHGLLKRWHENGQIESIDQYIDGKRKGTSRDWYEDGQLESVIQYSNDMMNGTSEGWYENGQQHWTQELKDGVVHGVTKEWDEQGNLTEDVKYENGQLVE